MQILLDFPLNHADRQIVEQFENTLDTYNEYCKLIFKSPILESFRTAQNSTLKTGMQRVGRSRNNYRTTQELLKNMVAGTLEEKREIFDHALSDCQEKLNEGVAFIDDFMTSHNISMQNNEFIIGANNESSSNIDSSLSHASDVKSLSVSDNFQLEQDSLGNASDVDILGRSTDLQSAIVKKNSYSFEFSAKLPGENKIYNQIYITPRLIGKIDSNNKWYVGVEAEVSLALNKKTEISNFETSITYNKLTLGFSSQGKNKSSFQIGIKPENFFVDGVGCKAVVNFPLDTRVNTSLNTTITLNKVNIAYIINEHMHIRVFKPNVKLNFDLPTRKQIISIELLEDKGGFINENPNLHSNLVGGAYQREDSWDMVDLDGIVLETKPTNEDLLPMTYMQVMAESPRNFTPPQQNVSFLHGGVWFLLISIYSAGFIGVGISFFKNIRKK